ncbi:MAG: radical SAM protein, partial [Planctomycetia bacterium]|nr:radical SAM protein [Planctomycetia bacterium]
SYRWTDGGQTTRLADLLVSLDAIDGLDRIKFVTNYPRDMTDDLIAAVRDLPKVCHYLHVPAQHGSDDVLKRMKRGYTIGEYLEMHARLLEAIPHAAVTSDFIVGLRRLTGSLTTCLKRSRRNATGCCSKPKLRSAWTATAGSSARVSRCSLRGSRLVMKSGQSIPAPTAWPS